MEKSEALRIYSVTVTAGGVVQGKEIELDNNYEKLTGIYLIDKNLVNYPKITFSYDGRTDLLATDFPVEFLMSSKNLSPDNRFKKLDLVAQKKPLIISVKDPGGNTYPYTLNFVYRLENKIR